MRRILSILSLSLLLTLPAGASVTVPVASQEDFDRLDATIHSLEQEDEVYVRLEKGTYFYRDGHLDLSGMNRPGFRLFIEGNGSLLIPVGKDYAVGPGLDTPYDDAFSPEDGFVSLHRGSHIDLRQRVKACKTHPIPVSLRRKVFRFRCSEPDLSEEDARDAYIILTQWYVGAVYKVEKIRNGWLYFHADRKYQTKLYEEFRYGRCRPRYVLYNQRSADEPRIIGGRFLSPVADTVRRCEASTFCRIADSRMGSFKLEGCRFPGNRSGGYLLHFERFQSDSVVVSDCTFEAIRSHLAGVLDTPHFRFRDNRVEECYLRGVYSDYLSADSRITGNVFRDHGRMLSTAPAVYCQGPDFLIADNIFEDFAYSAIGLGTHYVETDRPYTSGLVTDNEIYQTEEFRRTPMATLIDSGAIYVWTQNKGTVIRHNYIHDISGAHGNRGILCDDGGTNISILDNLILGIDHNSYCIDLRRRYAVERKRNSFIRRVNVGNRCGGNVVDGRLRFHIRRGDPDSFRGKDTRLPKGYDREAVYREWKQMYTAR